MFSISFQKQGCQLWLQSLRRLNSLWSLRISPDETITVTLKESEDKFCSVGTCASARYRVYTSLSGNVDELHTELSASQMYNKDTGIQIQTPNTANGTTFIVEAWTELTPLVSDSVKTGFTLWWPSISPPKIHIATTSGAFSETNNVKEFTRVGGADQAGIQREKGVEVYFENGEEDEDTTSTCGVTQGGLSAEQYYDLVWNSCADSSWERCVSNNQNIRRSGSGSDIRIEFTYQIPCVSSNGGAAVYELANHLDGVLYTVWAYKTMKSSTSTSETASVSIRVVWPKLPRPVIAPAAGFAPMQGSQSSSADHASVHMSLETIVPCTDASAVGNCCTDTNGIVRSCSGVHLTWAARGSLYDAVHSIGSVDGGSTNQVSHDDSMTYFDYIDSNSDGSIDFAEFHTELWDHSMPNRTFEYWASGFADSDVGGAVNSDAENIMYYLARPACAPNQTSSETQCAEAIEALGYDMPCDLICARDWNLISAATVTRDTWPTVFSKFSGSTLDDLEAGWLKFIYVNDVHLVAHQPLEELDLLAVGGAPGWVSYNPWRAAAESSAQSGASLSTDSAVGTAQYKLLWKTLERPIFTGGGTDCYFNQAGAVALSVADEGEIHYSIYLVQSGESAGEYEQVRAVG